MNAGRFRSDLFFRNAPVRVELPPLRERLGDLPMLVEDICAKVGRAGTPAPPRCSRGSSSASARTTGRGTSASW